MLRRLASSSQPNEYAPPHPHVYHLINPRRPPQQRTHAWHHDASSTHPAKPSPLDRTTLEPSHSRLIKLRPFSPQVHTNRMSHVLSAHLSRLRLMHLRSRRLPTSRRLKLQAQVAGQPADRIPLLQPLVQSERSATPLQRLKRRSRMTQVVDGQAALPTGRAQAPVRPL